VVPEPKPDGQGFVISDTLPANARATTIKTAVKKAKLVKGKAWTRSFDPHFEHRPPRTPPVRSLSPEAFWFSAASGRPTLTRPPDDTTSKLSRGYVLRCERVAS
jgi:hypothetical protein